MTDPRQRFASADEMRQALRAVGRTPVPAAAGADTTRQVAAATAAFPPTSVLRAPPAPPRHARSRWSRYLLPGVAVAIVAVLLLLFVFEGGQPTSPSASSTSRTTAVVHPSPSDAQATAITQLAASLADGGLPGDRALASALDARPPRSQASGGSPPRQASLTLAGVLLAGGGITEGQFQDVATVLQPTGATVPTTTTTTDHDDHHHGPSTVPTPPVRGDHKDHGGLGSGPLGGPAGNTGDVAAPASARASADSRPVGPPCPEAAGPGEPPPDPLVRCGVEAGANTT